MVLQFPDGMHSYVQNNGKYYEPFPMTIGVKQGFVVAPILFSIMLSAMLTDACCDARLTI